MQRSLPKCIGCVGKNATDVVKKRVVPDINVFISGLLWTGIPHHLLEAGEAETTLQYVGWVTNGQPIDGNPQWYRDSNGNYFWSGGVK